MSLDKIPKVAPYLMANAEGDDLEDMVEKHSKERQHLVKE